MRQRSTRQRRPVGKILLRLLLATTVIGAAGAAAVGYLLFAELRKDLPPIDQIAAYRPPVASQVYAANGELVGEFYLEKRYLVPLARIPRIAQQAFIAAEDSSFYQHHGIDPMGILRAALANAFARGVVQGGSTITQQVVKALLLTPERSLQRKVKEIVLSLRLERQFSKDDILYLYLNQIYLGSGAYGVAAAAQVYFDKDVQDLDLAEASLLAGLPQAPSRTSPIRHPKRARSRQVYVLARMQENGFITAAQRKAAEAVPLEVTLHERPSFRKAPDYVEYVRRSLEDRYGSRAPYELGLRIETALDPEMQEAAESAVRSGLKALDRRRGYRGPIRRLGEQQAPAFLAEQEKALTKGGLAKDASVEALVIEARADRARLRIGGAEAVLPAAGMSWAGGWSPSRLRPGDVLLVRVEKQLGNEIYEVSLDEDPQAEGSLLAMEAATGYVRAMVGGYDFRRSQFNRAVQAMRQPGSAFKPFVYAAAFDRGYTPASIVIDAPLTFDDGSNKLWKPENYDEVFHGATRLREALVKSMNVVTVKVAQGVGLPYLLSSLPRFGFSRPFPRNLSIALGSAEVTLLELVRAYDAFATGGSLYRPIFVTRIVDGSGNVIEDRQPSAEPALSPETAYLVTSLMKSAIDRGTGRGAAALGRPAAGKTGTTNDQMDAWFLGFTPDLVAGAWVGFDEKKTLGKKETGGRAAVPIWLDFMKAATRRMPERDFAIPPGIVFANIDPATGERATPGETEMMLECFRRGTEPQPVVQRAADSTTQDFFRGNF